MMFAILLMLACTDRPAPCTDCEDETEAGVESGITPETAATDGSDHEVYAEEHEHTQTIFYLTTQHGVKALGADFGEHVNWIDGKDEDCDKTRAAVREAKEATARTEEKLDALLLRLEKEHPEEAKAARAARPSQKGGEE